MKILVTGGNGQLGHELGRTVPAGWRVLLLSSRELDVVDRPAVERLVGEVRPDMIVNAAAYTAVDRAESEPERAFAVNGQGVAHLAGAARIVGARLLQVSTDFVFDGAKSSPYTPTDEPAPASVYGRSKLEGELRLREILGNDGLILRTSWLYSAHGHNFVKTMLRLMAERDSLTVVADQVGTPTWAAGLARAIWQLASRDVRGVHHWSDAGVASWYDFAVAIQEEAMALGLLDHAIPIHPIRSVDYPTPARRPPYSVLDKSGTWETLGYVADHWRVSLREMLLQVRSET